MLVRLRFYIGAVCAGAFIAIQLARTVYRGQKQDVERERASRRVDAMKATGRIRDDVESDPYLVDRAHEWLRKSD
jgi:hypothetical protein